MVALDFQETDKNKSNRCAKVLIIFTLFFCKSKYKMFSGTYLALNEKI
jgi:hypothetical protein